jgi:SpoVK/Ycf46/Vps4 family AAA+-type ATPase
LPDSASRKDIFARRLSRRKQSVDKFDLDILAGASEGFTGSEIEQAVVSAFYRAYAEGTPMTTNSVKETIEQSHPISVVVAEKVQALRDWAKGRTVLAN